MAARRMAESDVVAAVYEAALHPYDPESATGWPECLALVKDYLRCPSIQVFHKDLTTRRASFSVMDGLDAATMQAFYAHYVFLDPNYHAKQRLPVGTVTASNFLMPDAQWENLEWYYDFTRQRDIFYQLGALIDRSPRSLAGIGLQRPRRAAPFSRAESARLQRLVPHLRRAFQVSRILGGGAQVQGALLDLLDRVAHATILLDGRGRVCAMNRRAADLLALRDGLAESQGGIEAQHPRDRSVLHALIAGAVRAGLGAVTAGEAGGTARIRRATGRPDHNVLVTPLRAGGQMAGLPDPTICAAVIVSDPSLRAGADAEALRARHGLSPAEARVALDLADGLTLAEVAERRGIRLNTVRAHLRGAFAKMGVTRQSQLVRLVLSGAARGETRE